MLKQGLAPQDCALERPVFGKVVRLESKQPKSGFSVIKARGDGGLN